MRKHCLTLALFLSGIVILGAASLPDADDLVRQGNAAFAQGEYDKAEAFYRQAEAASTDPGLVAFNKAAALYRAGQYKDAEKHYWLCLGDAGVEVDASLRQRPRQDLPAKLRARAGTRLARVLYNVASCVVRNGGGSDGDALAWALVLYDQALRLSPSDPGLRADILHNLKLARDLIRLYPPKPAKRDSSSEETPENQDAKKSKEREGSEQGNTRSDKSGSEKQEPGNSQDKSREGEEKNVKRGKRTAGKGNLAALPDTDELAALSPEEAATFLKGAVRRIHQEERRDYESQATETRSHKVLDW
jgi:tetratricopeptide (TPR) repeat protein